MNIERLAIFTTTVFLVLLTISLSSGFPRWAFGNFRRRVGFSIVSVIMWVGFTVWGTMYAFFYPDWGGWNWINTLIGAFFALTSGSLVLHLSCELDEFKKNLQGKSGMPKKAVEYIQEGEGRIRIITHRPGREPIVTFARVVPESAIRDSNFANENAY